MKTDHTIILDGDPRNFLTYREGSGTTIEIFDIAVGSERRQGKGRRLMELLFSMFPEAASVWAITRTSNEVAQQFYEGLGFQVAGVLRRFYGSEGADAVMYARSPRGPV